MSKTSHRRGVVGVALVALGGLLAACGSTVSQQQLAGGAGDDGGQLAAGSSTTGPTQGGTLSTSTDGSTTTGDRGASGAGPGGGAAGTTGLSSQGSRGTSAPFPTSPGATVPAGGTVELGFEFTDVSDGVYQSLSGSTASAGNPRAAIAAMVAYINTHGGLAGRKVRAVVHSTPYADALYRPDTAAQEACADFTQDHHVFAASVQTTYEPLVKCLARARAITVSDVYVLDRDAFRQYAPFYFAPGGMSLNRGAEAMASRLDAAGWFAHGKVGVLYDETPPFVRAKDSLLARLRSLGIPVAKQFGITSPAGDLSGAAAGASNAVLAFRSAGVDRVLAVDRGGGLFYLFSEAADGQHYYPEYGLNSNNLLMAQEGIAPKDQWANVTAVGWSPYDVSAGPDDKNARRDLCRAILRQAGDAAGSQLLNCDQALFIKEVVDRAGVPGLGQFDLAVNRLGGAYASPFVFSTYLAAGRNDGAASVRLAAFHASCSCLHWVSGSSPAS